MPKLLSRRQIIATSISQSEFAPYGQLILPTSDDKPFDDTDARLKLDRGTPRFYLMRLKNRGRTFSRITRHSLCTQCLGSLSGAEWYLAVCPPSEQLEPDLTDLKAFRIPGNCFVKLEAGTWHAGPYFDAAMVDFYNLELSDTNVADHFTYNFATQKNIEFEIIDRKANSYPNR